MQDRFFDLLDKLPEWVIDLMDWTVRQLGWVAVALTIGVIGMIICEMTIFGYR